MGNKASKGITIRNEVLSTGQIAAICGVAPRTAAQWIDSGRLKGWRIPGGTDRRVARKTLVAFLRSHGMPLGALEDRPPIVLLVGTEPGLAERLIVSLVSEPNELLPEVARSLRLEAAGDGFEAGLRAEELRPDVVVIDLAVGRSAGLAMAQALRRVLPKRTAVGPTLIALLCEDEPDPAEVSRAGFAHALAKPVDPQQLASVVAAAAAKVIGEQEGE